MDIRTYVILSSGLLLIWLVCLLLYNGSKDIVAIIFVVVMAIFALDSYAMFNNVKYKDKKDAVGMPLIILDAFIVVFIAWWLLY